MDLLVEKVRKSGHKAEIKRIYEESFRKEERMPFGMMTLMSCLWNTEFLSFYDGETLCGFIYMATIGKQSFVMFFAVDQVLRSKGYGSQILNQIQQMYPEKKIIISIEPCDDQMAENIADRQRRKRFYLKNGYAETGYFIKLAGIRQEVIIKNGEFDPKQFKLFFALYSNFTVIPKVWREKA